ncbi:MAG: autoinducer 2 ABC transporter substrate-binding protein [Propionibacteriaceae bacterium]|nr:autoinducer 2 ABC transporter substrate-binding protein [Propionibacteriaceae bacterium]
MNRFKTSGKAAGRTRGMAAANDGRTTAADPSGADEIEERLAMKQRRLIAGALGAALALSLTLTACAGDPGTTSPNAPGGSTGGDQDFTIAIVPKDSTNPWFVRMEEGVKRYAAETGLNVFQKGPAETDATMQAQVIQDLIAQGVDAIGVVPVDPGALETVLKEALDAGIVVVTHEGASQQNTMYNIEAFNNSQYGAFIMDNLAEAMGSEGLYTTMVGHVTNASHNEWADGGVAHQQEAYPNMTLLAEEPRVESQDDGEVAYQTAKELLKKYPNLKGIMGTSSFDAPGVARAIDELGLKGKVFTAGTGMPAANAQILKDGSVAALTLWDPAEAGYAMAELARQILAGEEIKAPVNLKAPGYEAMEFAEGSDKVLEGSGWVVITADNVDSFGF